ncbi:MAG: thymidylate kinase [Pirellulaceae bacterium]|nr:MAG: thymidylate kinase [Pirellulaceae bacterium]
MQRSAQRVGCFISIDGIDGAGKTTQQRLLAEWLESQGWSVVCCRDPGSTALGDQLRRLLLEQPGVSISLLSEMFLYMAARAQLIEELIRPALGEGRMVICDRFLLANVAYQGYGGGLDVEQLWQVGRIAVQGILPQLTIVLDLPVPEGLRRRGEQQDRIESRGATFLERVRQGYLTEAARHPDSIRVVRADQPVEAVADQIRGQVSQFLSATV